MGEETLRCFWTAARWILAAGGVFGSKPDVRPPAPRSWTVPSAIVAAMAVALCVGCGAQDRAKSAPDARTALAKTDTVAPKTERVKTPKTIAAKTPPTRIGTDPHPGEFPPKAMYAPAVRDPEAADPEAADPEAADPEAAEPVTAEPGETPPDETDSSAAESDDDCTVVKVFYGTDRSVEEVTAPERSVAWAWLWPTVITGGVSSLLVAAACRSRSGRVVRGLAGISVIATLALGVLTVYVAVQGWLLGEPSSRPKWAYGGDRGTQTSLGTCRVSVPKDHQTGELESPSILRLEFHEDPQRHVVLLGIDPVPAESFYADLKDCVGRSTEKEAFVFVHGYNVTFEDAARRTAQIAYDLKFDGPPIFFSWPSQGETLKYTVDDSNVEWSVSHLREFITAVADRSGAQHVHLIAHSMGNKGLTMALRDLALRERPQSPVFSEVVLTAPDIDADTFKHDIAPAIVQTARRVTLYASSNDTALAYSRTLHGSPRAGDSGDELVVVPGIDSIDVSAINTSFLGHSYYGSSDSVLSDLFVLLHEAKPPDQRRWLHREMLGPLSYWVFNPN